MPPTLRASKHHDSRSSDLFGQTATSKDPSAIVEEKISKAKNDAHRPVKVPKKRKSCKRIKYQKASFDLRAKLVQMVDNEGYSIRQAAKKLNLKYSTAKCIYKLFVEESRLGTTRISKDSFRFGLLEKDGSGKSESDELETAVSHKRPLTAGIKKIKKNPEESATSSKALKEEHIVLKQEYDPCLEEAQNKESTLLSSEAFNKNILQSDSTQSDSAEAASPSDLSQKPNSTTEPISPAIITYIPQMHQNCLVLIPVKLPANLEGRWPGADYKPSLFNPFPQPQTMNSMSYLPSSYLFNQANSQNFNFLRLNLANQLRTVGMRLP